MRGFGPHYFCCVLFVCFFIALYLLVDPTALLSQEKRDAAPGISWDRGTAAATAAAIVNGGDFFADDVASALSAPRNDG